MAGGTARRVLKSTSYGLIRAASRLTPYAGRAEWRYELLGLDVRYAIRGLRKRPLFNGARVDPVRALRFD